MGGYFLPGNSRAHRHRALRRGQGWSMNLADTVRISASDQALDPDVPASSDSRVQIDQLIPRIDRVITQIDGHLAEQLDLILHHPEFQALEAAWRGLKFVVDRVDFDEKVRIKL